MTTLRQQAIVHLVTRKSRIMGADEFARFAAVRYALTLHSCGASAHRAISEGVALAAKISDN